MSTLIINISKELENEVNQFAKENQVSINEIFELAFKKYILMTNFQKISDKLEKFADSSGYNTEESIFRDFS